MEKKLKNYIRRLLTKETVEDIEDGKIEIAIDDSLLIYMKMSISEIIKDMHEKHEQNAISLGKVNTVYYPGSSSHLMDVFFNTECELLVGADLVDHYFYRELEVTQNCSTAVEFSLEAASFVAGVTSELELVYTYFPEWFEDKVIQSIHIESDKCIIKFYFKGILRTIILYININVNGFFPEEFSESVDLIVIKNVPPNLNIPVPSKMYLVNRGMAHLFEGTLSRVPKKRSNPVTYRTVFPFISSFFGLTKYQLDLDDPLFLNLKADSLKDLGYSNLLLLSDHPVKNKLILPPKLSMIISIEEFERYEDDKLDVFKKLKRLKR